MNALVAHPPRPAPADYFHYLGKGLEFDPHQRRAVFSDPETALAFGRLCEGWAVFWGVRAAGRMIHLNPFREIGRVRGSRRRARRRGQRADLTWQQWFAILVRWQFACAYCGGRYESIDHIVPIGNGGGTTATNVVPACCRCNGLKGRSVWLG